MPTVEQRVRKIIADQLGIDAVEMPACASLEELGADAQDSWELLRAFEEAFDIKFSGAEEAATLQELVEYIERNAKSVKQ